MGDTMLHGVLNMPPELWDDSELGKIQRHGIYVEASNRIQKFEMKVAGAQKQLLILEDMLEKDKFIQGQIRRYCDWLTP